MTASKKPKGRPLKFDNLEELKQKIEAYFEECDREEDSRVFRHAEALIEEIPDFLDGDKVVTTKKLVCSKCHHSFREQGCILVSGELKAKRPYTITGLAVWLDTSRQTLLEYEGEVPGRERDPLFADTIKAAKQRCENYAEEKLYDKDYPTNGVKFSLSNNHHDWADKAVTTVNVDKHPAEALKDALFAEATKDGDTGDDAASSVDEGTEGETTDGDGEDVRGVLPPGVPDGPVPVPDSSGNSSTVVDPVGTQDGVREDRTPSGEDGDADAAVQVPDRVLPVDGGATADGGDREPQG